MGPPWCPPCWAPSPPASCPQCNQFFDLLQDLVDHVNDFHVKPEKDAGYCCHWEGCARHGRGFNARWAWGALGGLRGVSGGLLWGAQHWEYAGEVSICRSLSCRV